MPSTGVTADQKCRGQPEGQLQAGPLTSSPHAPPVLLFALSDFKMPVKVEPYNHEWAQHFQDLKVRLESFLESVSYISIEHVGITSVPGLAAKPTIDIDIIVARADVKGVVDALVVRGGFDYLGVLGIANHHLMRDPDQSPRRNIYVCVAGVAETRDNLTLRDTLCSRPDLRAEYAKARFDLAVKGINDVDAIEVKSEIVRETLRIFGKLALEDLDTFAKAEFSEERWGEIKTGRLSLREFEARDVDAYYELESNKANARFQDWEPRTRDEARELVFANMRNIDVNPRTIWELAVDYEGRMIGRVGAALTHIELDPPLDLFNLWFSFLPSMQGKGYATEAVKALIGGLLERHLEHDVELSIECDPRNTGSRKLAERLGFARAKYEKRAWECKGEWVDSMMYRQMARDSHDRPVWWRDIPLSKRCGLR